MTGTIKIVPSRKYGAHIRFEKFYKGKDSSEAEGLLIEGYASTSDLDRDGDIVSPAAFEQTLARFMVNPIVTFAHDWNNPIGRVIHARITESGLWVKAFISKTAERITTLIREGILQSFSIGYSVLKEECRHDGNHLYELELHEIAVVPIPANPNCLFSMTKALKNGASAAQIKALYLDERRRAEEASTIRIVESPKIKIIDGPVPQTIRVVSS